MVTLITYATRASLRPAATLIEIFTGSAHSRVNAGDALADIRSAVTERREADEMWAAASAAQNASPRSA